MPHRNLFHRPTVRWHWLQRAVLATLAAMALTACDAEVPATSSFPFTSILFRSLP